jgi:phosphohistidine phosphatase SixA
MSVRRMSRWLHGCGVAALVIALSASTDLAADDAGAAVWATLAQGGHVAVIRHGNAPPGSGGDPPGFKIDDCATQRNLDELGREQARALGEAFRAHGVRVDRVVSSPWCRCVDTARLMAVGEVETSWALVPDTGPSPTRFLLLKELVSGWRGPGTLVLVTHALTMAPLTGGYMAGQAETFVIKPAGDSPRGGTVVGRIATPGAGR